MTTRLMRMRMRMWATFLTMRMRTIATLDESEECLQMGAWMLDDVTEHSEIPAAHEDSDVPACDDGAATANSWIRLPIWTATSRWPTLRAPPMTRPS